MSLAFVKYGQLARNTLLCECRLASSALHGLPLTLYRYAHTYYHRRNRFPQILGQPIIPEINADNHF